MLTHDSIIRVNRLMEQTGGEYCSFGHEPPIPEYREIGHVSLKGAEKITIKLRRVVDEATGDVTLQNVAEAGKDAD